MKQKEDARLGFFRRMFLAMTDFRLYPFVQREKVKAATAYFTLLVVLITIFISLHFSHQILEGVSSLLNGYDEKVPEFTFQNGRLNVTERIYNIDNDHRVVVDTYMNNEEFANTDIGKEVLYSNSFIVINNDGVIYGDKEATMIYLFKNLAFDLNKNTLREYLTLINEDWTIKLAIMSVTWLGVFIAYYMIKMINVLFLIIMAWILNIIFGMKLKFSNYYRIVVYAVTLPFILELISLLYIGRVPEFVSFAYQLLAYIYIFYALRALKLDYILISAPGSDFKEKVENMIHKLENEIDEKMKKDAEEEKDEENNNLSDREKQNDENHDDDNPNNR